MGQGRGRRGWLGACWEQDELSAACEGKRTTQRIRRSHPHTPHPWSRHYSQGGAHVRKGCPSHKHPRKVPGEVVKGGGGGRSCNA